MKEIGPGRQAAQVPSPLNPQVHLSGREIFRILYKLLICLGQCKHTTGDTEENHSPMNPESSAALYQTMVPAILTLT